VVAPPEKNPRYWLDAGPVVRYALSGASLVTTPTARRAANEGMLLSVSDPAYAPQGPFARLPATASETEAIRKAFGSGRVVALQGAAADEAGVRAALPGKRYLHLATHGVVERGHDQSLAGLVLASGASPKRDTATDGMLQLFEIYDLRLDCDLAVLSACETSAGAYVEGEGVYALSRGFLAAGARGVVASLWSVEDTSTAALVGDFFTTLAAADRRGEQADAARALRDAKRRLRAKPQWSAPFFWAPFVLTSRD
jgi:CHAT domain-containing protein